MGTSVFQDIFDELVRLAIFHHIITKRLLITDSMLIQANANKNLYTLEVLRKRLNPSAGIGAGG
ncbi:hypothetical protein A3848_01995 [Paenibacillus sp. P32E]|nr:hypothetical protein A3848_01995 [Paenibacillus sp. P32E]